MTPLPRIHTTPVEMSAASVKMSPMPKLKSMATAEAMNTAIQITRGLLDSDTKYETMDATQVESYLNTYHDCYERTHRGTFNRVYVDLDGEAAADMSADDFEVMDSCVKFVLSKQLDIGGPYVVMASSKHGSAKGNVLSYRIHMTKLHGSKLAVKQYVEKVVVPAVRAALAADESIGVSLLTKREAKKLEEAGQMPASYIKYDDGVYSMGNAETDTCGRKMRMWSSTKPNDFRPLVLEGDGSVLDTLITYIPADSVVLPEPAAPAPKQVASAPATPDPSDAGSISSTNTDAALLEQVVDSLGPHRWNNYQDFITIGMACFNEGVPLAVWERNAAKGSKNKPSDCANHWRTFRKSHLKQGTLWMMLKEDNPAQFKELAPSRSDYRRLLTNQTHADVAEYFFSIKPNNYLFEEGYGWYYVQSSNVWVAAGKSYPPCIVNDIFRTLKMEQLAHERVLAAKQQVLAADESEDAKEKCQKIEQDKKTSIGFAGMFSNKTFVEGVIAFLRGLYAEQTARLCVERQLPTVVSIMDEQRNLFAFSDMVYDVEIGAPRPIKQTDYISITCGYAFPKSNAATRAAIEKVLFSIWEDKAMVQYMKDVISTSVCGTRNAEEWYIWSGRGGNGKGMLMELINRAMGGYFYDLPNDILTKAIDKPNTPQPDLANCRGRRFLNTTEPESSDKILEGTTKRLTGGDQITARGLYKDPITYKPQFMLTLQCNNLPHLNSLTGGSVRRIRVVPFPFQFVATPTMEAERKGDAYIKNVLCRSAEWRDEFILMMLENYQRVKTAASIAMPRMVQQKTSDYIQTNNPVGSWWSGNYARTDERDEKGRPVALRTKDVMAEYKSETGDNSMTAKRFKEAMEFNGVDEVKTSRDEWKGVMMYVGWKRREEAPEED